MLRSESLGRLQPDKQRTADNGGYARSYMSTPIQGSNAPVVQSVLRALERLASDLRHRTEQAERRAEDAEKHIELERNARQDAESRVAVAEQQASDALRRAELIEML